MITLQFPDPAEATSLVLARDDFLSRFTKADLSFRTKVAGASLGDYLELLAASVLPWEAPEVKKVRRCLEEAIRRYGDLARLLPAAIRCLKLDGAEEPGNAYTRGSDCLVLHPGALGREEGPLSRLLVHELFHLVTRNHPSLKQGLYAEIGFSRGEEPALGEGLRDLSITNPDAPRNEYYFRSRILGAEHTTYPLLFATDPGSMDHETIAARHYDPASGELFELAQIENYRELTGGNTGYEIQPEEILAENVTMLLLGEPVRDGGLSLRIDAVLRDPGDIL